MTPTLKELYRKSKEETDFHQLLGVDKSALESAASPKRKAEESDDESLENEDKSVVMKASSMATTPPPAKPFAFKKQPKSAKTSSAHDVSQQAVPKLAAGSNAVTPTLSPRLASKTTPVTTPVTTPATTPQATPTKKEDKGKSLANGSASKGKSLDKSTTENAIICDIFSDVKIYIPEEDSHAMLRRYFIAFDGNLLQAHEKDEATHILVDVDADAEGRGVTRVTSDWIWHSIRKRELLNSEAYGA